MPRKKTERRDSRYLAEDAQKKVKGALDVCVCGLDRRRPYAFVRTPAVAEKSSWLGLARNPTGAGQWRPARCKLVEEEEGCLLNIYVDVSGFAVLAFAICADVP